MDKENFAMQLIEKQLRRDEWGYPITSDKVTTRKRYYGRYIENDTPHATLLNVPTVVEI